MKLKRVESIEILKIFKNSREILRVTERRIRYERVCEGIREVWGCIYKIL